MNDLILTSETSSRIKQIKSFMSLGNAVKNFISKSGFRNLLFVLIFALSAAPILLLTAWVETSSLEKEVNAVKEKHLVVAKNLSNSLSRYALDVKIFFELLAEIEEHNSNFEVSKIDAYQRSMDSFDFNYFLMLNSNNRPLSKISHTKINELALPDRELLDKLRQDAINAHGKTTFSGVTSLQGLKQIFLVKNMPNGKLALASLRPDYIRQLQKSIVFGKLGHSMIVDQNGRVIAHPNVEWENASKDASGLSVVRKMIEGKTGVAQFYSPPMKADMIAGYTFVPETGWGVMVPQPFSELISQAHNIHSMAMFIAISLLIICGLVSWRISQFLNQPLQSISKTAQSFSLGKWDARVGWISLFIPKEIRHLGQAIDLMGIEVHSRRQALLTSLETAKSDNQAKSQFLSMISHEIRTPMNGVLGILELLDDEKLDREQKECISIARKSGEDLLQLIDEILDFSKIKAGKLQQKPSVFNIRELIEQAINLLQPIADSKNLNLKTVFPDSMPEKIISDSNRIRQVLLNLLGNALKFTNEGGVTVTLDYFEETTNSGFLKVAVEDTGIGISKLDQSTLFDEFSQCDNTYTRTIQGAGLGLSITKHLTALMKGNIVVSSQLNKGSSFTFTIPVKRLARND
jgi:signal transduction histidine kinase